MYFEKFVFVFEKKNVFEKIHYVFEKKNVRGQENREIKEVEDER